MAVVRTLIGNVRGPQGEDGSSFEFKKTYASVAAMNNDFSGSDTQTGDYVLIATASADNADNGKMYRKGNSAWIYVAKISGPTGATGPAGPLCPLDTSMAVTVAGQAALDAVLGPTLAGKLDKTGDSANNTVTYTSDDVADGSASAWETVQPLTSEEKHESLFAKISKVIKNVRFLYKLLGTTDISGIGSGTVTDILSALHSGKFDKANVVNNLTTTTAGYALDAREGKTLADNVSTLNDALSSKIGNNQGGANPVTFIQQANNGDLRVYGSLNAWKVFQSEDHVLRCAIYSFGSQTVAANTHTNLAFTRSIIGNIIAAMVVGTPNAAYVFANVNSATSSGFNIGVNNTASSAVTGTFSIAVLYTNT